MDPAATAKAWTEAAEQLKNKKQLETACVTIARLAHLSWPPTAAVTKTVLKLKLPRALLEAAAAVLGERKRQRDWRAETYALRVGRVVAAYAAVLRVALQPAQQPSSTTGRPSSSSTPAHGSSSTAGNARAARPHAGAWAAGSLALPEAVWSRLLPKLELAMQDVAAVLETACSSSTGSTTGPSGSGSSSGPSKQADGMLPLASVGLPAYLLALAEAAALARPGGLFASPGVAALAVPAAHLAVVALKTAANKQQATTGCVLAEEVAGNINCIRAGRFLLDQCRPEGDEHAQQSDEAGMRWKQQQQQLLLRSPHFGQLMLVMLAVQTQLLLQEHFPQLLSENSSSSSSSSSRPGGTATASGTAPALQHVELWQDLGLPRPLLDQAATAYRKLTTGTPQKTFVDSAVALCWALQSVSSQTNAAGRPAAACDLSSQQLQLAISAMRVPLLLMDVAGRVSNRLNSGSSGSSSSRCEGVLDMEFAGRVVKAVSAPLLCWRVLGSAGSSSSAGSSATSAGSSTARSRPAHVCQLQLSDCRDVLLQQLLQMARYLLAPPSVAGHQLAGAAAAGRFEAAAAVSTPQASNSPLGAAHSSSSSSKAVRGSSDSSRWQEFKQGEAILSCCLDRLEVVLSLARIVNKAVEQQQQQQAVGRQQACRGLIAEVMQLLQQHLREVLLPLLCAPTGDFPAVVRGGQVWNTFCTVMADFCSTGQSPSPALVLLLGGVSSPTTGNAQHEQQQQQQQLFGLLLSVTKAAGTMSQMPWVTVIGPDEPSPYSMSRDKAWKGCTAALRAVVAAAEVGQQQQQQQQRLMLLARAVFVGSKLAASYCAAWAAGKEDIAGTALAGLQESLSMLVAAAKAIKAVMGDAEATTAAAAAAAAAEDVSGVVPRLQQQLLQQLAQLVDEAAHMVAAIKSRPDRNFSSSDSTCASVLRVVEEAAQQLQQWGLALCGQCSVSSCCNNPGCTNLTRSSEQALVGGRQCVCSGCMAARFCSRECQVEMWPHHKQLCKSMKRQRQRQQQQQQQDVQGQQDQEQDLLQEQRPTE